MTPYEHIASSFHTRIDTIAGAVDALAPGLQAAAQQIVDAVLNDQRILVCAGGDDTALGSYAGQLLRSRWRDAPPLPALALSCTTDDSGRASLWSDVRTLAKDGDVLLCIDTAEDALLAREAAEVAAQRSLGALLMSGLTTLPGTGILLPLHSDEITLRRELALMSVHSLRELIADLLMGEK